MNNAIQWLVFGEQLVSAGVGAINAVKDAAAANGVAMDTATLDKLIDQAQARQHLAEEQAKAQS